VPPFPGTSGAPQGADPDLASLERAAELAENLLGAASLYDRTVMTAAKLRELSDKADIVVRACEIFQGQLSVAEASKMDSQTLLTLMGARVRFYQRYLAIQDMSELGVALTEAGATVPPGAFPR
jgi:hypothetical protein